MEVNFDYVPVKNTYKIINHLKKCKNEPLVIFQGSQGASKTVSLLMLIIDKFRTNPKIEITICSAEKTKLMDTAFNDLKKICLDWNIWGDFQWFDGKKLLHKKQKGTGFIEFIGLDTDDIGKGRRRDIIYINEVNKVKQDRFFDISQRAKKVLVDFNPDQHFYIHDLMNDNNFISLDFTGNEKLSEQEVKNIYSYKERGFNADGTIKNEYYANKWRVYGLGEIGSVEGRIFQNWNIITDDFYNEIKKQTIYGIDFGVSDPFAIVEIKQVENNLYCKELNYKSENEIRQSFNNKQNNIINSSDGGVVLFVLNNLKIPKDAILVCDSAYPDYIRLIKKSGWEKAIGVTKGSGSVMFGISLLQNTNVFYTESSKNIDFEYQNYVFIKDRMGVLDNEPQDKNNHLIDSIRYIRKFLNDFKII